MASKAQTKTRKNKKVNAAEKVDFQDALKLRLEQESKNILQGYEKTSADIAKVEEQLAELKAIREQIRGSLDYINYLGGDLFGQEITEIPSPEPETRDEE